MEKTRFTFRETEHVLAERIELTTPIVMYWEKKREICPHCKETIIKGDHYVFSHIECWHPYNKSQEECKIEDVVFLGIANEFKLLLTKDKIQEALEQSKVFTNLRNKKD